MTLADYLREDTPWKAKAACRDVDSSIFFPGRTGYNLGEEAKKICRGCAVRAPCLEYALSYVGHYDFGIYAGTNAAERRVLRRERAA